MCIHNTKTQRLSPGRLPKDMVEVEELLHMPSMELTYEGHKEDHGGQGEGHFDHAQLEVGDMVPVVEEDLLQETHSSTSSSSNTIWSTFRNGEEQGLDTNGMEGKRGSKRKELSS
ncbi:hypothetical protein AX774_g2692 [Zancudomyces culisetae]|uniref:Uncharacterized protein n=1 Tax=Zancudomyces culisetae TaxID=1213189 RepID=A0A1R1PS40_ZANCU|nr:hypothetical protein AX774_g2692 [Zancudomyces culisetae]|eukprot:OMH83795.1 hypothetical protein AX774_g2692 [Zancudomyces culisetae]